MGLSHDNSHSNATPKDVTRWFIALICQETAVNISRGISSVLLQKKDDHLVQMLTLETCTHTCAPAPIFFMIFSQFYSPFEYKFMTSKTDLFSFLKAASSLNTVQAQILHQHSYIKKHRKWAFIMLLHHFLHLNILVLKALVMAFLTRNHECNLLKDSGKWRENNCNFQRFGGFLI